jgi:site-specific DNA-methyltransferase (adenine-specific)
MMMFNAPQIMDGLDLLGQVSAASAPLVFFDPQYREGLDKLKYGNDGERQRERAALPQMSPYTIRDFCYQIDRVLKPSGHLMLWMDKFSLVEKTWERWVPADLQPVDMITWSKGTLGTGCRSRRTSEHLLVLQKEPLRAKGVWTNHSIRDVWEERAKTRIHPHARPEVLISALILATTKKYDLVLDPAAGSYATMRAAHKVGRQFLGCDLLEFTP